MITDVATVNNNTNINSNNILIPIDMMMSHNMDSMSSGSCSPPVIIIRMIMQGKEVGSIIGKRGDNIKKVREESGAKINVSDGSCPERIVTVTGSIENICRAFGMICRKFEEDLQNLSMAVKTPITLRLILPASQCGSLIGKHGNKIKEIRESTGAFIQVASEMLPNSTERTVTVSGTADAITECIRYICGIIQDSPPKGANLPYRPKPAMSPIYLSGGQPYLQTHLTLPPQDPLRQLQPHLAVAPNTVPIIPTAQTLLPGGYMPVNGMSGSFAGLPQVQFPRQANLHHHFHQQPLQIGHATHEMAIPNDLIGCIIGRGGQKINEIRQVSGANIKISNAEDGSSERKVSITGMPDTVSLAQYLISTSMELHKAISVVDHQPQLPVMPHTASHVTQPLSTTHQPLQAQPQPFFPPIHVSHPTVGVPMHQLVMKVTQHEPYNPYLAGYNLAMVDPATPGPAAAVFAGGGPLTTPLYHGGSLNAVHCKPITTKLRVPGSASSLKAADRPKFAPY